MKVIVFHLLPYLKGQRWQPRHVAFPLGQQYLSRAGPHSKGFLCSYAHTNPVSAWWEDERPARPTPCPRFNITPPPAKKKQEGRSVEGERMGNWRREKEKRGRRLHWRQKSPRLCAKQRIKQLKGQRKGKPKCFPWEASLRQGQGFPYEMLTSTKPDVLNTWKGWGRGRLQSIVFLFVKIKSFLKSEVSSSRKFLL